MHSPPEFDLDQKPVFDWNRVPIGRVTQTQKDPKTHTTKRLLLTLSPEAQSRLGIMDSVIELPASHIFGIRRDSVTLDRSLTELAKIEQFASILKK